VRKAQTNPKHSRPLLCRRMGGVDVERRLTWITQGARALVAVGLLCLWPAAASGRAQVEDERAVELGHSLRSQRDVERWTGAVLRSKCGTKTEESAEDCRILAQSHGVEAAAMRVCLSLKTDKGMFRRCLAAVADQRFSPAAVVFCSDRQDSMGKIRCLEATAGRRLDRFQLRDCLLRKSPRSIHRCVKRTHDYVFDPEIIHHLITQSLQRAPVKQTYETQTQAQLDRWATMSRDDRMAMVQPRERAYQQQQARLESIFSDFQKSLISTYPQRGIDDSQGGFIFNFAGGANGQYQLLYCSAHEYVIIFGSPTDLNAYSGRYAMAVHDWLLEGKMQVYHAGDHYRREYGPGSHAILDSGTSKIYSTEGPTYMVEYARGRIGSALDFGVRAPARYVTRDRQNRKAQVRRCRKIAVREFFAAPRRVRARKRESKKNRRAFIRELRR